MKYTVLKCFITVLWLTTAAGGLSAADGYLTLVYTNSLNGNIDYCHCSENPNGGLVKRATEIKNIRKHHSGVVLVETGDFFPPDDDPLLARYLLDAYRHIGYDGITPGDQEFAAVKELLNRRQGLPLLCNNITMAGSTEFRKVLGRHVLLRRGNLSVGIIGSIAPSTFKFYPRSLSAKFRFTDQAKEINRDAAELRERGADIIVLLSHSGYENDRAMEKLLRGVDVVVGGHSQTLLKEPVRGKKAIIVQAGSNGAHIGVLELTVKNGAVSFYKNTFRRPDEHRPADDPVIRSLIERYRKELEKNFKDLTF